MKDATQLNVRISKKQLVRFKTIVRQRGESVTRVLERIMQQYIKENDIGAYIDDVWQRAGDKIKKNYTLKDVPRIIDEVRCESHH